MRKIKLIGNAYDDGEFSDQWKIESEIKWIIFSLKLD